MPVFAIVALSHPANALRGAVEREFAGKFFVVSADHWHVNATGTAKEIGDKIGVIGGGLEQCIIYNVAGYYGLAPNPTWEWLKANWSASGG